MTETNKAMGWDINAFIEFRDAETPDEIQWNAWAQLHLPRNYPMFGAMASGAHYYFEGAVAPRGIPSTVSWQASYYFTKFKQPKCVSHLSCAEYARAIGIYKREIEGAYPESEYLAALEVLEFLKGHGFESRIVFWFDD